MTLFQVSYLLLWALAIVLIPVSIVLLYLLAQLESQFKREGTGHGNNLIGRKLPGFQVTNVRTGKVENGIGYPGQVHVVLALSDGCNTCRSLMRELAATPSADLKYIRLLVLCMGELEGCKKAVSDIHAVPTYVHDARVEATADLWMAGFPAALVVDASGIVVDVRHPLALKGVRSAVRNATLSERFALKETTKDAARDAATFGAG